MWVDKIEKLVIAAVCLRSATKAKIAISAPVIRIETYGVPSFGWMVAKDFGSCPFLAIANETLDKPMRFVKRTLAVATRAPKEIVAINVKFPVALAASVSGDPDPARTR